MFRWLKVTRFHSSLRYLLLAVTVYCFALLSALPTWAATPNTAPIDHMGVGWLKTDQSSLAMVLLSIQAPCEGPARRVVLYSLVSPQTWIGCWVERGGVVLTMFEDGDKYPIPVAAFQWSTLPEKASFIPSSAPPAKIDPKLI